MEKKKVLLLGDSIRQSYCARVKELLADECEVYYVPDNGAYTLNTLWAVMLSWLPALGIKGEELDLIHWNNGHWDHHRNLADLEPLSTIEQYLYYNRRLHKQFAAFTDKLIWATTIPVSEKKPHIPDGLGSSTLSKEELNSEIKLYNDVLGAYLKHHGVWINDLYELVAADPEGMLLEDGIHLTPEGAELAAQQVAGIIRKRLHAEK